MVRDIARIIRFANKYGLRIAVRGQGHSIYGRSLVAGGINPATYRFGPQVDNVESLQVVTGDGQVVTGSREFRCDLLDAGSQVLPAAFDPG